MRPHNRRSPTSRSATAVGSTLSRPTSATSPRSAELLERIRAELPPLAGVVHGAGVLDDALLTQQSVERFRTALAPKAFGARHLHRLTKNDELDFFIVYSSAASVLGSPGQANYATANALLDGLVAERKAQGLPATSINWGPWAHGGMATSHAARANLGAQGLIPLEPTAALNALNEVIAHGTGQAIVLKANWQRAAKGLGGSRPFILDHVLPSAVAATRGDSELLRQLHDVPEASAEVSSPNICGARYRDFLRLAQPPAATSRFLELGTDSLMAVEFSNRLLRQFGGAFTISATAVFDYPTIGSLAEYLAGRRRSASRRNPSVRPSRPHDSQTRRRPHAGDDGGHQDIPRRWSDRSCTRRHHTDIDRRGVRVHRRSVGLGQEHSAPPAGRAGPAELWIDPIPG